MKPFLMVTLTFIILPIGAGCIIAEQQHHFAALEARTKDRGFEISCDGILFYGALSESVHRNDVADPVTTFKIRGEHSEDVYNVRLSQIAFVTFGDPFVLSLTRPKDLEVRVIQVAVEDKDGKILYDSNDEPGAISRTTQTTYRENMEPVFKKKHCTAISKRRSGTSRAINIPSSCRSIQLRIRYFLKDNDQLQECATTLKRYRRGFFIGFRDCIATYRFSRLSS